MSSKSAFTLVSLLCVAVLGVTVACGDNARTPTAPSAPTAPATRAGTVSGLLRGEAPWGRHTRQHPELPNATVTVIGGPASGTKTTTGADGTYQLNAAGSFKLRFEHPFYVTTESSETAMTASGVTLAEVTLLTAPWSISGRVTDSLGNPVADAEITTGSSAFFEPYGTARSNAEGRYTVHSTKPHFASVYVVARKPGFEPPRELQVPCCGTAPALAMARIVSITPTAPTSLRVGESVEMPASVVVFDNGVTRNIFVLPESSVPSVVNVSRSSHWYAMTGYRAGVATLTFDLWGAIVATQVQVQ